HVSNTTQSTKASTLWSKLKRERRATTGAGIHGTTAGAGGRAGDNVGRPAAPRLPPRHPGLAPGVSGPSRYPNWSDPGRKLGEDQVSDEQGRHRSSPPGALLRPPRRRSLLQRPVPAGRLAPPT